MIKIISFFLLLFCSVFSYAQTIAYADVLKKDGRAINFEILGNIDGNTLIYKNQEDLHRLSIYDNAMKLIDDKKLDFISGKTYNVDFAVYPDFFYVIYQVQRGSTVYCNAAKINGKGDLIGNIVPLDTIKLGMFADNKIYYVDVSENKKKLLVYRVQNKNDQLRLNANVYDENLTKTDSLQEVFENEQRRLNFSDIKVANDGTIAFVKQKRRGFSDYMNQTHAYFHKPGTQGFFIKEIKLDDVLLDEIQIKIDNQNRLIFFNSFTYTVNTGAANGILSMSHRLNDYSTKSINIIALSDSLRKKLTTTTSSSRQPFNNFNIKEIITKKDSGQLITLEETYTDTRGNYNNRYDRLGYGYDPYSPYSSQGYYRFQRGYYNNYYSPYYNRMYNNPTIYNSNDIVMISMNASLDKQWENIINKKQSDVETDNHLSYSIINMGGALHYLYLLKDNNKEVMNDHALQPDGTVKRYATIKTGEKGFYFMPRLAKQISANSIIVPGLYRNSVSFCKIFF